MIPIKHLKAKYPRAAALVEPHIDTLRKAVTFALVGVVNVMIDGGVFLITYGYLNSSEAALRRLDAVAVACGCAPREKLLLIGANATAWIVAVSCSYVMNSHITFAAESGRRLRWKLYWTFVASGILGAIANTVGLVVAADFMPVLAAKGCGILAGFSVNFSMSHFVVFRRRPAAAGDGARP
jgi:putative flippase GtrA